MKGSVRTGGSPREPMPAWFYALVLVRRGDEFLLVEERDHGGGWYLPAGRVEPGESLPVAALREVREEAGVDVILDGVYRIEHTAQASGGARVRVLFSARPADDREPKSQPDEHTLRAGWFTAAGAADLPLRSEEVTGLLALALAQAPAPLAVLRSIVR
ncbi:MAG: NUDIX hydrolase [bacterium]|nr:NUDIX hydrolase [bacterium]